MRHKKEQLLHDALTACQELRGFTAGKSLCDVETDRGLQLIIEREFEIIGEALVRLRKVDESAYRKIGQGPRIIGTRNLLAHGYDVVEHVILWDALQEDIPLLEIDLQKLF